jgi:trk system potassium uptake protein
MKQKKRMVVVLGSSRLGAAIASLNSNNGVYTAIIDKDALAFRKLDTGYSGFTIQGDAEDTKVLMKAHIEEATEVDVTTGDDDANIFLAFLVEKLYHPESVIVRLQDDKKAVLFENTPIRILKPMRLTMAAYEEGKAETATPTPDAEDKA